MTTLETPTVPENYFPLWMREPAKIVGWVVSGIMGVATLATLTIAQFSDLIPPKYQDTVKVVVSICAVVAFVGNRIQTWLTRNGFGKAGNGKDGVWSPAAVAVHTEIVKAQTITPEVFATMVNPKLLPPKETQT